LTSEANNQKKILEEKLQEVEKQLTETTSKNSELYSEVENLKKKLLKRMILIGKKL